jgi:hypothetical protein
MILAFELDLRSEIGVYERIFLRTLGTFGLEGRAMRDGSALRLYAEGEDADVLGEFASALAEALPHSIFLYGTQAEVIETMPEGEPLTPPPVEIPMPFCPRCQAEATDEKSADYFNIFTRCDVCGYPTQGQARNDEEALVRIADRIVAGEIVEIATHYGTFRVGDPRVCTGEFAGDLIAWDLATVQKYAHVSEYELTAMGAQEKPRIRLKKTLQATSDFPGITADLIRFGLPDDMVLYLLMETLHRRLVDLIALVRTPLPVTESWIPLERPRDWEPLEVVVAPEHIAIVSGERSRIVPESPVGAQADIELFERLIAEHRLQDSNIVGLNLRRHGRNAILVRGEKYGTISYLSLMFRFETVAGIFRQIVESGETGKKQIANYRRAFPELYDRLKTIRLDDPEVNLYRLWGIVAMIFGLSDATDPLEAARVLEANAMSFLGTKGPRIDYIPVRENGKVSLDPIRTIRSAISFKLADVDPLSLSYGVIESFLEFVGNELNEIQQTMNTTTVAVYGSLLDNKHLFAKIATEAATSHRVCFPVQMTVDA